MQTTHEPLTKAGISEREKRSPFPVLRHRPARRTRRERDGYAIGLGYAEAAGYPALRPPRRSPEVVVVVGGRGGVGDLVGEDSHRIGVWVFSLAAPSTTSSPAPPRTCSGCPIPERREIQAEAAYGGGADGDLGDPTPAMVACPSRRAAAAAAAAA
uniref:Uncharacterized protein n=1 Tax=Oryza rufipogon TaxID=4529 RepID=A0A0E0Q564_ORYRU